MKETSLGFYIQMKNSKKNKWFFTSKVNYHLFIKTRKKM